MLKTRHKVQNKPPRIIIAGEEGVGKTNFGVSPENSVVISLEDRVDHIDKNFEIIDVKSFDEAGKVVRQLITEQHNFKNLCIDSIDWLEQLCHSKIIGSSNYDINRVNGGYGSGLRESEKLHRDFIASLEGIRNDRGMSIIATAHVEVKEEKNPDLPSDFDSFQIKMDKRVASLWREWADAIMFARFKTFVNEEEKSGQKKTRAFTDGSRVLYATNQAFFRAKNHYGLPEEINFTLNTWQELQSYFNKGVDSEAMFASTMQEVIDLTAQLQDDETKKVVMQTVEQAEEKKSLQHLQGIKDRLVQIVNQ
jgi:hypothetical protein